MSQLKRLINLQELLLLFRSIERQLFVPDTVMSKDRRENDVEHSYNLVMASWYLSQYYDHLDTNLCIRYALAHDLVEVYAGDTFAYDKSGRNTKEDREMEAKTKLRGEWGDFDEMLEAIHAYEAKQDLESRFVYALDKLMPIILGYLSKGKSWHYFGVTLEHVMQYKGPKIAISPEIKPLYDELVKLLKTKTDFFPPSETAT